MVFYCSDCFQLWLLSIVVSLSKVFSLWHIFNCTFCVVLQPLSRELARGKVTMYKIQYMDSHAKWTQSLDPSSFMFTFQNLSIRDEYRLTIEAGTVLGFNETLPVPVLAIRIDPLCKILLLVGIYSCRRKFWRNDNHIQWFTVVEANL